MIQCQRRFFWYYHANLDVKSGYTIFSHVLCWWRSEEAFFWHNNQMKRSRKKMFSFDSQNLWEKCRLRVCMTNICFFPKSPKRQNFDKIWSFFGDVQLIVRSEWLIYNLSIEIKMAHLFVQKSLKYFHFWILYPITKLKKVVIFIYRSFWVPDPFR